MCLKYTLFFITYYDEKRTNTLRSATVVCLCRVCLCRVGESQLDGQGHFHQYAQVDVIQRFYWVEGVC